MKNEMMHEKYLMYDAPEKETSILKKWAYDIAAQGFKMLLNTHDVGTVTKKKYNVAICAIFKNEAKYLKEWIEFHRIVGVEHFYLYNNNSEDDYQTILAPYEKQNLVTLIDWPKNQAQMEAYETCIKDYSADTKWIGFIDIDEFVVPRSMDTIYDFLRKFEKNRGAVKIYWRMYGTSGQLERDMNGLVTEDFTVCWPKYYNIGKCFYNTAFEFSERSIRNAYLHHSLWTKVGKREVPPVNIFDEVCIGERNKIKTGEFPIQINHYFTKSYHEYALKRAKGDVYFEVNPHDEEYFYNHEKWCDKTDYVAYKYLIKLKRAMAQEID